MDNITRYYGVYRGVVKSTSDPIKKRRVKLVVPQTTGEQVTNWAWPLNPQTPVPQVGQGVWVTYQGGDPDYPVWVNFFGKSIYKGKEPYLGGLSNSENISDVTDLLTVTNNQDGTYDYDVTQTILNTVRNRYYGSFLKNTVVAQTVTEANHAERVSFDTTVEENGVTRSGGTFTIENSGVYTVTFSMQLTNTDNQAHDAKVWIKVNDSDLPDSASVVTVPGTHGGVKGHNILTVNYVQTFDSGDTLELWGSANSTTVNLESIAGDAVVTVGPASPAVILTIAKVR